MALCNLWSKETPAMLTTSIERSLRVFGYDSIKPLQSDAVNAALRGEDVFVNVPTGYGKSLIYQILPFCASFLLKELGVSPTVTPRVLVVSPLLALMQDQAHKLKQVCGANPFLLSEEAVPDYSDLSVIAWTHILASPEALLEAPRWRKLLLTPEVVNNIVAVVIDEAHCIVKW